MKKMRPKAGSFSFAFAPLVLAGLMGCSTKDDAPTPAPDRPTTGTPVPSAHRTMIDRGTFATSPVNLLLDPGFSLDASQGGAAGSFLAFYEQDFDAFEIDTIVDSRSPAGYGSAVAKLKASGATDTRSRSIFLLTNFLGGDGPFTARVWASKSDVAGNPVDLTTGDEGVAVTVTEDDPNGLAYDLQPVPDAQKTAGGRTWTLLEVRIPKALPYGGFFLLRAGTGGGQFLIASPEVVADPLVGALGTRSSNINAKLLSRAVTSTERAALARYRAIPPRLVPAGLQARPAALRPSKAD